MGLSIAGAVNSQVGHGAMSGALTARATWKGQQRNIRRIKTILIEDMGWGETRCRE